MGDQSEPKGTPIGLHELGVVLEAEYLDSLSDEEIAREFEEEMASMSPLEQKRLEKAGDRLQRRVAGLLDGERAWLSGKGGAGLRAAAHDGEEQTPMADLGYIALNRLFEFAGRTFSLGVATTRPREIVLIGEMPAGASALVIGVASFALVPSDDRSVTRCKDLGEPQLNQLLRSDPPPAISITFRPV